MRTSQTFVLRLLVDPDEPGTLRGNLSPVAGGETQPFADGPALLALLRRMVITAPQPLSTTLEERKQVKS